MTYQNKHGSRRPPAMTAESRENQLIALAVEVAVAQLLSRTASAQVITHYLKLATAREKLEIERLRTGIEVDKAKSATMASQQESDAIYNKALAAFRGYSGFGNDES